MIDSPGAGEQAEASDWPRFLAMGTHPDVIVVALLVGVVVLLLSGVLAAIFFPSGTSPTGPGGSLPGAARLISQLQAAQRDRQWVSGANIASAAMLALATLVLSLAAPLRDHTRDFSARACAAVAALSLFVAGGAVAAIVIDLTHRAYQASFLVILQLSQPLATGVVALAVLWWVEAVAGHSEGPAAPG